MMHPGRLRSAGIGVLLTAALAPLLSSPAVAMTHHVEGHVRAGILDDSNVKESLENETSDQAFQVFGSVTYRALFSPRFKLSSVGRLGLHRYRNIKDDSRVMGETRFELAYSMRNQLTPGARLHLQGRDYADSAATRGFGSLAAEAFLRFPAGGAIGEITATRTVLDYSVTPGQEQVGNRVELSLSRRYFRRLLVLVRGGAGAFDFNRKAVRRVSSDSLEVLQYNQDDSFWHVGAELSYLRGFYLALGYRLLENDSNTFGWDFVSHRFDLTFGDRLSPSTSIRMLARLDLRSYSQNLQRFAVVNFDSEREDNNSLVGELGHAIGPDLTLKIRLGWHHNESVFRDRRYTKLLSEAHLEWRF